MTILDLKNDVYKFLLSHDEIEVDQFIKDNSIIQNDIDFYKECLKTVLDDFVVANVLRKVKSKSDFKYLLTQPINSYSQNVELSAAVAIFCSEALNGLAEALGDNSLACDSLAIKEKDIKVLAGVAKEYLRLLPENNEQI